jgi:broad specificity phosphatase PhoE
MIEGAEGELASVSDLKKELLNGAANWREYSYGGCALIYDADIAERLCAPSEYRRTREGKRAPSTGESWLDVQARALGQAATLIATVAKEGSK